MTFENNVQYGVTLSRRPTLMVSYRSTYQLCQFFKDYQRFWDHPCPHHQAYDFITQMMGTEMVTKTLVVFNELTRLIDREDTINICREFRKIMIKCIRMAYSILRTYSRICWGAFQFILSTRPCICTPVHSTPPRTLAHPVTLHDEM
jgi:hypothetical protein